MRSPRRSAGRERLARHSEMCIVRALATPCRREPAWPDWLVSSGPQPARRRSARMPFYENVFVARQDLSAQQVEAMGDTLSQLIEAAGGKVTKKEYWGLRT